MHTTLDRQAIEAKIYDWFVDLGLERDDVTADARLEDLDLGSLDIVEIAQVLEDEFDIEILGQERKQGASPEMATVGEAVDALLARIEKIGLLPVG